ncbi:MAG: 5-(carboxyamino)imidazole ribonucleotide mutase [Spirochaetaceae bacterium]|jgi:5-(carboxyamino)imidazole ribonucleotide mutase|nr:5-(carboxyamino)imidazole ribonucleotide mutase [Spirochaetaceae bacterium]
MKVALILGSASDLPVAEKAFLTLKSFDIEYEARIMSAHRTPEDAADFSRNARERDFGVIIAFAGMAAHLAGVMAAHTTLPVIGVPCKGGAMDGLDALLSTAQMPSGVPVATVALNGGVNAALLAAQILSLADSRIAGKLIAYKQSLADDVRKKDAELAAKNVSPGRPDL